MKRCSLTFLRRCKAIRIICLMMLFLLTAPQFCLHVAAQNPQGEVTQAEGGQGEVKVSEPKAEQKASPPEPPKGAEGIQPSERSGQPTLPRRQFGFSEPGRVVYDKELKLEFSFVRTDIEHVIQFFSKVTGKVFVLHPQLEGTVTIIAPSPLTVEQAFEVLSAVLHVRGFAMLGTPRDFIIRIVPLSEARTQAVELRTDTKPQQEMSQPQKGERPVVSPDQLVTQVIPLRYANAKQLQQELAPLISAQNALIASTTAGNLLIVIDTQRNVERLMNIVRMVDVSVAEAMELAIIKLKYADAEQLAQILTRLFGIVEPTPPRPGAPPGQPQQPEGARPPQAQPQPQPRAVELQVQIVPEPRTNSLIVWASKERLKMVRELVEQLDVETTELLTFEVIPLRHADAVEVDRILSEIFEAMPGARVEGGAAPSVRLPRTAETLRGTLSAYAIVSADPRTNSLIVAATVEKMQFIKAIVEKLDVDIMPPIEIEVIPLKYADAVTLADTLRALIQEGFAIGRMPQEFRFQFERFRTRTVARSRGELERQIAIAADERANALIIAATKENIERIKQLVSELDKDFAPPVMARVFRLQYADAAQVADILNQLFEQTPGGQRGFGGFFWWAGRQQPTGAARLAGLRRNVVEADVRTNSVIVTATEDNMREFERLIRELDQPAALTNLVRIYKIQNVNATELASTINSILAQQRRPTGFFFFVFAAMQRQFQGPLRNLQDISVTADAKTNSLIVTAPPYAFDVIEQLIEQLDTVLPQVFIEVMIVDVTLTKELELGVEWAVLQKRLFGETMDSKLGTELGVQQISGGLSWEVVSRNFQALLQALARENKVRVLATPHILTLDNTPATITIGKSYPVPRNVIITATGPQYTIAFEDITLTLEVTPHINNSGYVLMDIRQTINDIAEKVILQGQELPVITKREANASVQVRDGQTVVIGGILKHDLRKFVQGVPILKDLPIIGSLFSRTKDTKERTELMVFITPRIIRTGEELQDITEREKRSLTYPQMLRKFMREEAQKENEKGEESKGESTDKQSGGNTADVSKRQTITLDDFKIEVQVNREPEGE